METGTGAATPLGAAAVRAGLGFAAQAAGRATEAALAPAGWHRPPLRAPGGEWDPGPQEESPGEDRPGSRPRPTKGPNAGRLRAEACPAPEDGETRQATVLKTGFTEVTVLFWKSRRWWPRRVRFPRPRTVLFCLQSTRRSSVSPAQR